MADLGEGPLILGKNKSEMTEGGLVVCITAMINL